LGLLVPGTVPLLVARLLQGTAWAVYSVAGHTLVARLAPVERRGEISGYYQAMAALAGLLGPGIGVAVYISSGELGPVVVASCLGLITVALAFRIGRGSKRPTTEPGPQRPRHSRWSRLMEPSALPSTAMLTAFMSAQSLFFVFPPVYAVGVGAPVESLAVYYPVFGTSAVLSQLVVGRLSDRIGRGTAIRIGCVLGIIGLVIAVAGSDLLVFGAGACVYVIGVSLVSPTLGALTMDRAPANRIGSAMATYSIGYQIATGASSLLWGMVISVAGFPWAFLAAIALQFATVGMSLLFVKPRGATHSSNELR